MKFLNFTTMTMAICGLSQVATASTYGCSVSAGSSPKTAILTIDISKNYASALARLPNANPDVSYVEIFWSSKTSRLDFYLENESREVIQQLSPIVVSNQPVKGFSFDVESADEKLSTSITCALNK